MAILNALASPLYKTLRLVLIVWSYSLLFSTYSLSQVNRSVFENLLTELESKSLYVNDIIQDRKGFIWLGTEEGLIRYDGVTFRYYLPETGNNHSISHKWITTLYTDSKGTLWIGTRRGVNRYNDKRNDFDRFMNDPQNPNR
jgi:ligand-binding sensor domain-containing protein